MKILLIALSLLVVSHVDATNPKKDPPTLSKDAVEELCDAIDVADFDGVLEIAQLDGYKFEDVYNQVLCKSKWKGLFHLMIDNTAAHSYSSLSVFDYFEKVANDRPSFDIASKILNKRRSFTSYSGVKHTDSLLDYTNRTFALGMSEHEDRIKGESAYHYLHDWNHPEWIARILRMRKSLVDLGARTIQQQRDGTQPKVYPWLEHRYQIADKQYDSFKEPEDCDTWYLLSTAFEKWPADAKLARDLKTHIARGNIQAVKGALRWCDTNPNKVDSGSEPTPLMIAARHNQVEIAKILLQQPAININLDYSGYKLRALDIAYMYSNSEMVDLLKAHKAICYRICEPLNVEYTEIPIEK